MNKLVFAVLACPFAALASTSVTSVSVTPGDPVAIAYATTGDDAVMTISLFADGRPLGDAAGANLYGDVNKIVSVGSHTAYWPAKSSGVSATNLTAEVKAWSTDDPPDYVAFDLVTKERRYYTSTNALPRGGIGSDVYRTDTLLLRRIPAAGVTWSMGSPKAETDRIEADKNMYFAEPAHQVKLTKDYYLAVFETTQFQQGLAKLALTCLFTNSASTRPVEHESLKSLRGSMYYTPAGNPPTSTPGDGPIRQFKSLTDSLVDLPTEAQWEYACRAGTTTPYSFGTCQNGNWKPSPEIPLNMRNMFDGGGYQDAGGTWYAYSDTAEASKAFGTDKGTARVGTYLPNGFGLYDMHGNVWEWCLDGADGTYGLTSAQLAAVTVDPVGPATNNQYHVIKGGAWNLKQAYCRSAVRGLHDKKSDTVNPHDLGYRLCWNFSSADFSASANYGTTVRPFAAPASSTSAETDLGAFAVAAKAVSPSPAVGPIWLADWLSALSDECDVTTAPLGLLLMFR